jgi:hypothetical protein
VKEETQMTYTATAGELTTAPSTTRRLLAGGALAAPLFVVSALAQAATRPGYDLTRHPVSVLSNGDLGWIQIATFLITGLLTLGYAVATRRVLPGGRAGTWGPCRAPGWWSRARSGWIRSTGFPPVPRPASPRR